MIEVDEYREAVLQITSINEGLYYFWSSAFGWAPDSAAELMEKSRLDWQCKLSKSLLNWEHLNDEKEGDLILAWANLGALLEGTMKLFLSVHLEDYKQDDSKKIFRSGKQVSPDSLTFDVMRQYFEEKSLFEEHHSLIALIQVRRNAIHAYQNREIGNFEEFVDKVKGYLEFLRGINTALPYPDDIFPF